MVDRIEVDYKVREGSPTLWAFLNDESPIRGLMGPVGCIAGNTPVLTEFGPIPIADIDRPMRVLSWDVNASQFRFSLSGGAFPKGRDYLYRVTMRQGEFVAAGFHRVLCADGTYRQVAELCRGDGLSYCPAQLLTSAGVCQSVFHVDVLNCMKRAVNWLDHYAESAHQYGPGLLLATDTGPAFSPAPIDAHRSSHEPSPQDDRAGLSPGHSHSDRRDGRSGTDGYGHGAERPHVAAADHGAASLCGRIAARAEAIPLFLLSFARRLKAGLSAACCCSSESSTTERTIISIERQCHQSIYWDMQVGDTNNYVTADGTIHHNSGKSSACSVEVVRRAIAQAHGPDGFRHSRFGVIRNTYRELMDTTVKTFCDWFPEGQWGHFNRGDMTYYLEVGKVRSEIVFRALDRPQDVKKLLSAEYTGAWVNEAREIPLPVVQMLETRVGRYPSMKDGVGASWYGIFMDTNPPDSDHWWYAMFEEARPSGWTLFRQPSGRSDKAENRAHLKPDYYERLLSGKHEDWIRVYVDGEYGYVREGKPVYPEYLDSVHCKAAKFIQGATLVVGLDFGLTPAAAFCQMSTRGQWRVLSELVATDMGVVRFSEVLARELQQRYPNATVQVWGDPSGDAREADERTCFDILRAHKIMAMPAPGNNEWTLRREAVAQPLSRLIDGEPGLLIDPACLYIRKGLAGKYEYRRLQVAGEARFEDKPNKNEYSHPCEALQYALLGGGENARIIKSSQPLRPIVNKNVWNPLNVGR